LSWPTVAGSRRLVQERQKASKPSVRKRRPFGSDRQAQGASLGAACDTERSRFLPRCSRRPSAADAPPGPPDGAAAQAVPAGGHPLRVQGGRLQVASQDHAQALKAALHEVTLRGTRRMLTLHGSDARHSLSVVPLSPSTVEAAPAVMLVLGRSAPCVSLSAYGFASAYVPSDAETNVLSCLIDGDVPSRIAATHRVALNTAHTQISSIRAETGSASMRLLIRELAMLPPLVSILAPRHEP
jgi:hypothetical protein